MRRFFLFIVLLIAFRFSYAQKIGIDSRGESIFTHYAREDARLEISTEEPLSFSYLLWPRTIRFVTTRSHDTTVTKFDGLLIKLSMLNSGDFPVISKLSDIRPGVGIKIGYQRSIELFNNIDRIPGGLPGAKTWGINAVFNVDNIKLYDTIKQSAGKEYPLTYGIEGNFTLFFKNKNPDSKWRRALAFNTSLTSTWNERNLLSYQEVSNVIIRPDVVALKEFDGKYGVLKKNFLKYRLAVSYPMYIGRLNPIPYVVGIVGTQNSPSYHVGAFINVLADPLTKTNYKIPSSIGIGFDWVYAVEKFSPKVNVFVKGSISLGKLKE